MLSTRITSPSLMGSDGEIIFQRPGRLEPGPSGCGMSTPLHSELKTPKVGKEAGPRAETGLRARGRASAFAGLRWDGRRGLCKSEGWGLFGTWCWVMDSGERPVTSTSG